MKKALAYALATGLVLGVATISSAFDVASADYVMPCSDGNMSSKVAGFCEDYTVDSQQAYDLVTGNQADMQYIILDVRSLAEWNWVGHPGSVTPKNDASFFEATNTVGTELEGKVVNVSIGYCTPPTFTTDVVTFGAGIESRFGSAEAAANITFITMCRSGSRSRAAALQLSANGYNVLNMDKGFEGSTDDLGRRFTALGWANENFPYATGGPGGFDDPYVCFNPNSGFFNEQRCEILRNAYANAAQ